MRTQMLGWPLSLIQTTLLAIIVFGCLITIFWTGFLSSDDGSYLDAGRNLMRNNGLWLSETHGGLRYTVTIPLGILTSLFGTSETVISILPIFYSVILLSLLVFFTWRVFGKRPAIFTGILAASFPLFVIQASIVNVDIPETLFCLSSIFFFLKAIKEHDNRKWLLLSGVTAGLAMLTRETGYGLLIVYGVLFLFGAYMDRRLYLWGALGVGAILCVEMFYYVIQGESPFYRFLTAAQQHMVGIGHGDFASGTGNLSNNRLLGPITAILVNQEFGFLYWAAVISIWYLLKRAPLSPTVRCAVQVLALAALVWFLWIGFSGAVRPLPRYFALSSALCLILVGVALAYIRSRPMALLCLVGLIAVQLGCLLLENTNPRFASRGLASFIIENDAIVYTDATTANRARGFLLLRAPDHMELLQTGPAPTGAYQFWNPNVVGDAGKPIDSADIEKNIKAPKRGIGILLTAINLETIVPTSIQNRLIYSGETAILYRSSKK